MPRARTSRFATSGASGWIASRRWRRRKRSRPTKPGAGATSCKRSPTATSVWSTRWPPARKPRSWRSNAQEPPVSQLPPPEHVAIIMDGNSRWARERLLPRVMGHKAGIETIHDIRELAQAGADLSQLEDATLASHLYTRGLPDPDLVVRTAGEMRLSNFLLWQTAYSEFYSTQTLWPDFADADFDEAIASYQRRVRRFGARPEEVPNRGR